MHKCLFLLGIIPSIASAQRISVGAVAGTNLTDDVRSGSDTRGVVSTGPSTTAFIVEPGARRLILGIKLEVNLSRGWSVEFDA